MNNKNKTKSGVQVIARAAAILRTLKENPSGMSIGQIARKLGLPRSTVQRIVEALREERLVIALESSRGLRLGPEIHALADASRYDMVELCKPHLVKLAEKTEETVDLSVWRRDKMIFLDQIQGSHRLRTSSEVGSSFPLTTPANGLSCLSLLADTEISKLAYAEWGKMGIDRNLDAFMDIINSVRHEGIAYDRELHSEGISAMGFAFRDYQGNILSISVPVPSSRFESQENLIKSSLLTQKNKLENMMSQKI
tara:strand:- start:175 stop:933 length:759 start_codon:yes stop_codon:yes gene_type:complete